MIRLQDRLNHYTDPHSLAKHDMTVSQSLLIGAPPSDRERTFRVPIHAPQRYAEKRFQRAWNARARAAKGDAP